MGRKSPSRSAVVTHKLERRPGCRPRCGRTANLQHLAHAACAHRVHSLDNATFTGSAGAKATDITALKVADDFPEIPLGRELGVIETFLGACLDEMLGVD